MRRFKLNIPLAGSCSTAISAACQRAWTSDPSNGARSKYLPNTTLFRLKQPNKPHHSLNLVCKRASTVLRGRCRVSTKSNRMRILLYLNPNPVYIQGRTWLYVMSKMRRPYPSIGSYGTRIWWQWRRLWSLQLYVWQADYSSSRAVICLSRLLSLSVHCHGWTGTNLSICSLIYIRFDSSYCCVAVAVSDIVQLDRTRALVVPEYRFNGITAKKKKKVAVEYHLGGLDPIDQERRCDNNYCAYCATLRIDISSAWPYHMARNHTRGNDIVNIWFPTGIVSQVNILNQRRLSDDQFWCRCVLGTG